MRRSTILLALIVFLPMVLCSQQPGFKTYSVQDGLVTNQVRCIFQDSKGFVWVGTMEGISQYNGHQFINYTEAEGLPNSVVNDFAEIDGKIFIALNDGSVITIHAGKITQLAKLPSAVVDLYILPGKKLICTTFTDGIYEYKDGVFQRSRNASPGYGFNEILLLNDSLLLSVTNANKLAVVSRDYRVIFDTMLPPGTLFIYQDLQQRIWFGDMSGISQLMVDSNHHFIQKATGVFVHPLLKNNTVYEMLQTADGAYWLATYNGLVRITAAGNYTIYSVKEGFPFHSINTIYCDRERNIWAGTAQGLVKIPVQNDIHYVKDPVEPGEKFVGVIIPWKREEVLIITPGQPAVYNSRTNKFSALPFEQVRHPVYLFPGTKPQLYATGNAVGHYDWLSQKATTLKSDPIFCDYPQPCMDANGNAFLNLRNGIAFMKDKKVWIRDLAGSPVTALSLDKQGFLWAGTWDHGLFRIQYTFSKDSVGVAVKDFSALLPDKFIRCLFTDSHGNTWVGTRNKGAFRVSPGENDHYSITAFDQARGLTSNFIRSFAESSAGDIWIGSLLGLDKLVNEKKGFRVFNFSRVNNLFGVFFSIHSTGKDEWICNVSNKLLKFTDQKLENTPPLQPMITATWLGTAKDNILLIDRTDTLINLKHFQNQARFQFSAASFINEKQMLYSYRLLGSNDTSWSIPQNIHEVSYASLQPEEYTFEVRTIGWNGEPGAATRFRFNIRPPFWKTGWFLFSIILLIAALFYLLYRYRFRQLQRVQQVRNRIAKDLHDDIGSTLTNISILTELSRKSRGEPDKAGTYLDRIREEIDASGQALDDIIWSVNSRNDTLQETAARMRRYAAELFDARNISYELIMDPKVADKKIPMEQRRDLFLIFKEALNNIHKHAGAGSVSISLYMEKDTICLVFRDNGKGFDAAQPTHRNGVANMKERVKRWKGNLDINSGNGKGTVISVRLPLSTVTQKGD